jgi:hypothetical protein
MIKLPVAFAKPVEVITALTTAPLPTFFQFTPPLSIYEQTPTATTTAPPTLTATGTGTAKHKFPLSKKKHYQKFDDD